MRWGKVSDLLNGSSKPLDKTALKVVLVLGFPPLPPPTRPGEKLTKVCRVPLGAPSLHAEGHLYTAPPLLSPRLGFPRTWDSLCPRAALQALW